MNKEKRICPFLDKNGNALKEGDKLIGHTNFDKVQGFVLYYEDGKNDYEKWRIMIVKEVRNGKWFDFIEGYSFFLSYHLEENKCICYSKIENYTDSEKFN